MRLSTVLMLSFMIVTISATFSITYFLYINSERILENQVINSLQSSSSSIEKSIETFLEGQEKKIELIGTQNDLSNEELNLMIKKDPTFYDLFVIAANGTVIVSSNPERIGLNRANRSYFINARNQTYINPVYFALVPQEYSISVSTPFKEGVLVGSMKISLLNDLISERTGLGKTGESLMAFINEKNEVVYFTKRLYSNSTNNILLFDKTPLSMQYALNNKEQVLINTKDYRGVNVLSFSNFIEGIHVGMVTKIDEEEAIGIARNLLIRFSIIYLTIILFVVIIIGFLISKGISGPIKKLTSEVDQITKGDLSIQLERTNIFEIQKLTDSLNRILATMKLAILRTGLTKSDIGIGEATKAKEEAEAKYKLLYETSLDARLVLESPKWNFISGNPAALEMFNLKDETQLITLNPGDLSPKTQPDGQISTIKTKKMIEKTLKEGKAFFEWTHKRYNGENFSANVLLSKFEENGKTYIQATVRDLTPEKKISPLNKKKK